MELHVLPPGVAARIAAGEVVERPASVVKELVENAIDAGATKIDIVCRGGGVEYICVADNGSGIPFAHVELAFERHATSKIDSLEDLAVVQTLGFRGEALPSIAAVADVELSTRFADEALGATLSLHGDRIVQRERQPRSRGTTIAVRRLFHHLPARLKFLKSESTENSHNARVVSQYALAHPSIAFSLLLEDRLALRSPGSGNLRDVVAQLYGAEVARAMLPVEHRVDSLTVTGLVAPASLSRAGRGHQSTFVNHRWILSPLLQKAIEEAYRGMLQEGRNSIAVLSILLPPGELDVNVHPSKAQVKFANEQVVFRAVRDAVKAALSSAATATSAEHRYASSPEGQQAGWAIAEPEPQVAGSTFASATPAPPASATLPPLRILGQVLSTYVVAEGRDGLYLIDLHAAHERVVFESLLAQQQTQRPESQGLLAPLTLDASPAEDATLAGLLDPLAEFGFTLEHFGDRTYLLRAVPAALAGADPVATLRDVLQELATDSRGSTLERLAASVACHSAVRGGQQLTPAEMRQLVQQLESCTQPRTCPHGRPTVIHFSTGHLERLFGRRL